MATPQTDSGLVERLATHSDAAIAEALGGASTVALLDFPRHLNVGDSVIWLGERASLGRLEADVVATCDKFTYSPERVRQAGPDVVLLHGGGNFGDLYPSHHAIREAVFRDLKGRPVVQLPQSINFGDEEGLERTRRLIAEHGEVTLLLRDEASEEFARRHFDARVLLAPDSAFALGPLTRPGPPSTPLAIQARTDRESSANQPQDEGTFDWLDRPTRRSARLELRLRELLIAATAGGKGRSRTVLPSMAARAYDGLARWNMRRGLTMLGRGEVAVTDRLHGHILCVLMGHPHVVVADRYGKIRQLWDTWTHGAECAHWAGSWDQAVEIAQGLVNRA